MPNNSLAPHETLELHEILSMEAVEIKKLGATISMAQDQELKDFIQDSINIRTKTIEKIQQIIGCQNS